MKLLMATTNKGKIEEIDALFREAGLAVRVLSLEDMGIDTDCPETGDTFLANATEKAQFYSRLAGDMLTAADDSGLAVEALNGAPGVFSARYAGLSSSDDRNTEKLLKQLEHESNRNARFVTVAALVQSGQRIASFTGEVSGTIIKEKRGTNGFGYDPVFYYSPFQKTFAQLTTAEKNKISHRANAFKKLTKFLSTYTG